MLKHGGDAVRYLKKFGNGQYGHYGLYGLDGRAKTAAVSILSITSIKSIPSISKGRASASRRAEQSKGMIMFNHNRHNGFHNRHKEKIVSIVHPVVSIVVKENGGNSGLAGTPCAT